MVYPPAELAYKHYEKDRGVEALVAWFRAELRSQDSGTQERFGAYTSEYLKRHDDHVEHLALRWRQERMAATLAISA